tara:strand:- start:661 stop:1131 length:471 start_codon:yes stop_codon:yes gene_type:complete
MTVKRFFKKCEEFSVCSEIADSGDYFVDGYPDNTTIYHICIKGSVRLAKPFDGEVDILPNKELVDCKKYLYEQRIYQALDDLYIIGFNPLKAELDWDGKLVKNSFIGSDNSYLICFDGNPVVNGNKMKRWDYASLVNKKYEVEINDGILALFTKKY